MSARHRDVAWLWVKTMLNGWSIALTVLGIVILFGTGFLGPQPNTGFEATLRALDPYRWYIAMALFLLSAYVTTYKAVEKAAENHYAISSSARHERVHKVFCDLLRDGEALQGALLERQRHWDERVRAELAKYCRPERLDGYLTASRHFGSERGAFPLEARQFDDALADIRRLVELDGELFWLITWKGD